MAGTIRRYSWPSRRCLALLPYLPALIVWQAATLALYLEDRCVAIAGDRRAWLPALAFPAVFINIGHGHNGFLTAALFGGGLLLLDRRPMVSGILLGLLCYKPQFGILIPLALAAGGYWRAFIAAGATVVGPGRGELVRLRHRDLGRVPRQPRLHADRGARGRRHRLPQDPEPVRGVARLARAAAASLCGAGAARACRGGDRHHRSGGAAARWRRKPRHCFRARCW